MIEKENLLSAIREGEICRNGDFVASRLIRKMEIFGFLPYCSTVATSAVFSSLFSGLSISDYLIAADRIACKVVKKISISGTEYEYRTFPIFKKIQINRTSKKILLEDFVYGHEFIMYVITDGYHFLPLTTFANYKFMSDGNGGILTPGMGGYCPDYKLSCEIQNRILYEVVEPVISSLASKETPYLGILGVEGVLTSSGEFTILELKPFLANHDCQAVLNLINENLYTLFEACAVGSFADDYDAIDVSENSSVSCVLSSGKLKDNLISGLELADDLDINHFNTRRNEYMEYLTSGGRTVVLTRTASTLSRARELLYENVDVINFSGKKYRKDICKSVD